MELEPGRDTTGSLVQNLRAGFEPPEPHNRTSRYSATAAGVSGRFGPGKPSVIPQFSGSSFVTESYRVNTV